MRAEPFACAILFAASLPALAEERDAVPIKTETRAIAPAEVASRSKARTARPVPFLLPARAVPAGRRAQPLLSTTSGAAAVSDLPGESAPSSRPSANAEGASRAVREALDDHRKPRQPRSVLSTALVLRVDGNGDSPALSVGGGGVASAVWGLLPR
jgi:hypothetical protein